MCSFASDRWQSSGARNESPSPRKSERPRRGRAERSAAAVSIIVSQARASGAGSVGSDRNFFVASPTNPKPINDPARLTRISVFTSTGGTSSA